MIPYMVGKLAPNSSHLTRGLVKYVPSRDYFRAVSSQNGKKIPPQSLNGSSTLVIFDNAKCGNKRFLGLGQLDVY